MAAQTSASALGAAPSCITRRNTGSAIRGSRQARWLVAMLPAGIDAASMARRCHTPQQKLDDGLFSPPAKVSPAARWMGA